MPKTQYLFIHLNLEIICDFLLFVLTSKELSRAGSRKSTYIVKICD